MENSPIVTTLSDQIDAMNKAIAIKMDSYRPRIDRNTADAVTRIFKKHSRVVISALEEQKIRNSIGLAIGNGARIPVGFTWGCSGMALSSMKLRERINYPRKGDLWGIWWFDILNKKIKHHYAPGIDLVIGDEGFERRGQVQPLRAGGKIGAAHDMARAAVGIERRCRGLRGRT